jgi:hypothetical protein
MHRAFESSLGMPELVEAIPCPKCGAPLSLAAGEVIVTCRYCGTASRMRGEKPFVLRHAMLSARLDRPAAEAAIAGWMDGGVMTPPGFRRKSRVTTLECAYVPFYVFEVDARTSYAGILTRTGKDVRKSGMLSRDYFWKVLARRSGDFPVREYKMPLAYKVPFDTAGMVRESRFLNAEVDEDEAERIAREQVMAHQRELLKDEIDVVEKASTEVVVKDTEFLHAPLWFASYAYKGRPFRVVIDAASGAVVRGEIPPPTGGLGEFLRGAVGR